MKSMFLNVFRLHYEGDELPPDPPTPPPVTKQFTQAEIDAIVTKRTEAARKAQRTALEQLEQFQTTAKMTEEQNLALEQQIQELRKQTLSAEEIAKREKKKAEETYQSQLTESQRNAQTWEQRHNSLKVNYEISNAAQKHGVLGTAIPMLESFLANKVTVEAKKDDAGQVSGFTTIVNFDDISADGKPIQTPLTVEETVKRMKELPDQYGYLFSANTSGGIGGSSGQGGGKGSGFRPGMSAEEYVKLRKENPSQLYSETT